MRDLKKIWIESGLPITEENIRSVFDKADGYRVSPNSYEATTTPFAGCGRAAIIFVLSGSCTYRTDVETTAVAPDLIFLPEGEYNFAVEGHDDVNVIKVYDLRAIVEAERAARNNKPCQEPS
ncbi:MAG: hypothetical protein KDA81_18380 [Planctomycetaceae bacterium]|nr:hypothetical protein [Planctomycetaceae bacterium]